METAAQDVDSSQSLDQEGNPIVEKELEQPDSTTKPLPEGFDPTEYGLHTADEFKEVEGRAVQSEKRYNDTRTSYNEDHTRLGREIAEIRGRMEAFQAAPPAATQSPLTSDDHLRAYQADQSIESFRRYSQALAAEEYDRRSIGQPQPHSQADYQRQADEAAQRQTYISDPMYKNAPLLEVEQELTTRPPTMKEWGDMYLMRQMGRDKYEAAMGEKAVKAYKTSQAREPVNPKTLPSGTRGTPQNTGDKEVDWDNLTDREAKAIADEHFEKTGEASLKSHLVK
jgi:hypothetical protein